MERLQPWAGKQGHKLKIQRVHLHVQVTQSSDGTLTQTPAFQSVPAGANTSTWSESGVQLLLQGDDLLPFNETYQAALLNQIGGAFKQAGVPYILDYEGAGVSGGPAVWQYNAKI